MNFVIGFIIGFTIFSIIGLLICYKCISDLSKFGDSIINRLIR